MNLPLTRRILLWGLLGPFLLITTLLIVLLRVKWMVLPSALALIGLAFCWQWRTKGLIFSGFLFFFYLFFAYTTTPAHEQFWHLGTTLSLIMSLIVTTLCLEELESTAQSMQLESKSRLDALVRVDEKRRETEKAWQNDRVELIHRLQETRKQIEEKESRIRTYQRQLSLAREEIETANASKQKVLRRLDSTQMRLQSLQQELLNTDNQQQEQQLIELEEVNKFKRIATERLHILNQLRCDHYQLTLLYRTKPENYWNLTKRLKETEARYRQLREQFSEKQTVLEETRKSLFASEERYLAFEHSHKEDSLQSSFLAFEIELQEAFVDLEEENRELQQQIQELEELISSLMTELASEQAHCLF